MRNVVVLTKDAAQITPGEEHGAGAVIPLDTGFFAAVGRDCVDFDGGSADEAYPRLLVAIHIALARAQVALTEVAVC